jgi:hypothetical protein
MAQEPPWDPGDTGAVPVGPEPEPTGSGGAGGGPGGWGEPPRTEPLAIAALVWAIVSIVVPLIGTIIALVLSSRAAEAIRQARGARKGEDLVIAARIVAGVVISLWAIGLVLFFALRGGDTNTKNSVAVPTQPAVSTTAPLPSTTVTTRPVTPTSNTAPPTTTLVAPSTSIAPPPPTTVAPTTVAPTTTPPTTQPPPTTAPPVTTTPEQREEAILQKKMLDRPQLGPSNRGVPDSERFVVSYTQNQPLIVTWAINNGVPPLPTGTATCLPPVTTTTTPPASTSSTSSTTTSTTTTSTTTTTTPSSTTTTTPGGRTTQEEARYEARQILIVVRGQLKSLNITSVQVVGTYPITGHGESTVAEVTYSLATVQNPNFAYQKAFDAPPAQSVDCLNPAFE